MDSVSYPQKGQGMQIKRYRGADMQEALQKVKQDLGTDAIILSTRQVRGGRGTFGLFGKPMLEVTAARDGELSAEDAVSLASSNSGILSKLSKATKPGAGGASGPGDLAVRQLMAKHRVETQGLLAPLQDDIHELKEILRATGERGRDRARDDATISQIRAEMAEMRQMLHMLSAQSAGLKDANFPENLVVLYQQLLFNGVEEKFARRLIEECARTIPPKDLEDFPYVKIFLARMLMKIVRVTGGIEADPGRQKVVALVGPTGVGKTTTVAKLASEQLLKHHRQVALITVDTFRIAAVEQLKVYAKIMGVPISVVNDKTELQHALQNYSNKDVVFVDTGGRSQRDEVQMSELYSLFGNGSDAAVDVLLTLASTTKDSDLTEITRKFGEIPIKAATFTKLDESTQYGSIFNHSIRFKLPVSYLATGQKVPEDLEVATKERLVDLLLNITEG
jgi:flagellar biosynthesis protein FlhF